MSEQSYTLVVQSEIAPVVPAHQGLRADQRLVCQFRERIVEIAPRRSAEIGGLPLTEIARYRTTHNVEGNITIGGYRLNEVSRWIEWKSQGY